MGRVVETESVKNGFRSQASFGAYNGYIIINPVDLDKYSTEESLAVVQRFVSKIGRMTTNYMFRYKAWNILRMFKNAGKDSGIC
jgi:hypothetical protein